MMLPRLLYFQKGVNPLASSRGTLNGPDWRDVATAMVEFQEMWNGVILIGITASMKGRLPNLSLTASMALPGNGNAAHAFSASASVSMLAGPSMDTDGALLYLLYELDKDLYRQIEGIQTQQK
jgi:hypothetical protein